MELAFPLLSSPHSMPFDIQVIAKLLLNTLKEGMTFEYIAF